MFYAVGNNSDEREELVIQNKKDRIDEGKGWRRQGKYL